jgi:hypothetical protein
MSKNKTGTEQERKRREKQMAIKKPNQKKEGTEDQDSDT